MNSLKIAFVVVALSFCIRLQAAATAPAETASSDPKELTTIHIYGLNTEPVAPQLYGIFFEDINFGGEGGLYAELIRNRFFDESVLPSECTYENGCVRNSGGWTMPFPKPGSVPGWRTIATGTARAEFALDAQTTLNSVRERSLSVSVNASRAAAAGVVAEGYGGIGLRTGSVYRATIWAKADSGFSGKLRVELVHGDHAFANKVTDRLSSEWRRYEIDLTSTGDDPSAELAITTTGHGKFWLGMVSLFPVDTWKNRPNGVRSDLMKLLVGLHPKFLRFPGGCVVEGYTRETPVRWKDSIGPIEERRGVSNLWGYRNTNGLGYHEFLQIAEDLQADGMFVFNCGMSCQGRSPEYVPLDQLDRYIQDALDAVEYAIGPVDSPWGAKRATANHPAPFPLKFLEIGNENWGPEYAVRYARFYAAIHKRYPRLTLIATSRVDSAPMDMVDDHYYPDTNFFIAHHDHYEQAIRDGTKIYVGEYASIFNCGLGNLRAAVAEAAFLVGLERNPDLVRMSSYAPLFKNSAHPHPWNPDAIVFDTLRAYGTPSYQLQSLFAAQRGDQTVASEVETSSRPQRISGSVGIGGQNAQIEFRHLRVDSADGKPAYASNFSRGTEGWDLRGAPWHAEADALQMTRGGDDLAELVGPSWEAFTLNLEARKIDGVGGVRLRLLDNGKEGQDRDYIEVVLGGPSDNDLNVNRYVGWAQETIAASQPITFTPETWHRLRAEVNPLHLKIWLDDQLIVDKDRHVLPDIVSVASREDPTGDIIIKVVNTAESPRAAHFLISGIAAISSYGQETVLTSGHLDDENTFSEPLRVSPVTRDANQLGADFSRTFPANSITVLRLHSEQK